MNAGLNMNSKRVAAWHAQAAQPPGNTGDPMEQLRVLLIDDDDFVRVAVARQLQSLGIRQVTELADGRKALQVLDEPGTWSVIICDLCLPGVDGIELVRRIAEVQKGAALVLISSREPQLLNAAANLARERGVRVLGTLEKPVTRGSLRALLAEVDATGKGAEAERAVVAINADDVRAALENNEFSICVQPKLQLSDRSLLGVEVLARWSSPRLGFIGPDQFVRIAEQSELIEKLTEVVLDKSLKACREWSQIGLRTNISVNFSAAELYRLDLPEMIGAGLQGHGLAPNQLIVEVTETAMLENPLAALDVLTRLRLHGVGLAIDDFGCGYSTLTMLRRVPFTELKLDRSFVMAAPHDANSRSILHNCIAMARELGLRSVAEGVETATHQNLITDLGCDAAQGYYFARPFPADQLPDWCTKHFAKLRSSQG
jgi:EAL domain-containing protein (putative c-di-GMP-specific phosphodiesterase class I)